MMMMEWAQNIGPSNFNVQYIFIIMTQKLKRIDKKYFKEDQCNAHFKNRQGIGRKAEKPRQNKSDRFGQNKQTDTYLKIVIEVIVLS